MSARVFSRLPALAGVGILVAASLLSTGPVRAGSGLLTTVVTPLSTNVTYSDGSTGLATYMGYTVAIANDPSNTNTINNVRFTATAAATDAAEKPTFLSADGATCSVTNADGTSISCTVGQLRAGQAYPTFAVFFRAPAKVTNGTADGAGQDAVSFAGTTYYAEGTGGVPQSPPNNSAAAWTSTPSVALGTTNPTLVRSVVPKSNANLQIFTGQNAVTTSAVPFATSVNVPPVAAFTTADIALSPIADPNCSNFNTCYLSQITIPGTFLPYLAITLRMDNLNIKKGTQIGSVVIYYEGVPVGDCASPTTPLTGTATGTPCIAKRIDYKSKNVPGWTADLDGDFEWQILNLKNGGFKVL